MSNGGDKRSAVARLAHSRAAGHAAPPLITCPRYAVAQRPSSPVNRAHRGLSVSKRSLTDQLLGSVRRIRLAEAAQLSLITDLVDAYCTVPALPTPGGPQLRPSGADGTPEVDEFLVSELHPVLGVSPAAAWSLIHDAINLRERHPHTWRMVHAAQVPTWQARQVAKACESLPADKARAIDERIAPALAALPWGRAKQRLRGYVRSADPVEVQRRREAARRDRFVRLRHGEDGMSWLFAQLSTVDAVTLGHAIDGMARQLVGEPGYGGSLDHARADALGLLARPCDTPLRPGLPRPIATMVVHLNLRDLATLGSNRRPGALFGGTAPHNDALCIGGVVKQPGDNEFPGPPDLALHSRERAADSAFGCAPRATVEGPGGLDDIGPILLGHLSELLAHHRVRVLPVVDLNTDPAVDGYAIPDRIRQHVVLRDGVSVFPFATRPARSCDLDHTIPWQQGQRGQTRPSNLGALDRRAHRAKTHGGWSVSQISPGVFSWTSPLGYRYRVDRGGTHRLPNADEDDEGPTAHREGANGSGISTSTPLGFLNGR